MRSTLTTHGVTATVDGQEHLLGARCGGCETHTFPVQSTCPRCGGAMVETALPRGGTVWSCTVQRIRPKPPYVGPDEFEPFAVGYVDLGTVRVESRLDGKPVDQWRIGDAVHLVAGDPDGVGDVWSYRFVPDEGGSS
jgi:uncharacterized OB-fold protein